MQKRAVLQDAPGTPDALGLSRYGPWTRQGRRRGVGDERELVIPYMKIVMLGIYVTLRLRELLWLF